MEEAMLIHDDVAGNACLAVLDGDGGRKAEQFLSEQLDRYLQQDCSQEKDANQVSSSCRCSGRADAERTGGGSQAVYSGHLMGYCQVCCSAPGRRAH